MDTSIFIRLEGGGHIFLNAMKSRSEFAYGETTVEGPSPLKGPPL